MASGATPVPSEREPELLGQTVVVIGGSAGYRAPHQVWCGRVASRAEWC